MLTGLNDMSIAEQFYNKLTSEHAKSDLYRISLIQDPYCPIQVIKSIILEDTSVGVIAAAIQMTKTPLELIQLAFQRFPSLETENFWQDRERKQQIEDRILEIKKIEDENGKIMTDDRDQLIKGHIIDKDSLGHAESHLGLREFYPSEGNIQYVSPKVEWTPASKKKIALVIAPSWGILFSPYNLSKLTGMLRKNDYNVKVYDVNIESYHYLLSLHNEDYWESQRFFLWANKGNFEKYLLPELKDLFNKIIMDIFESKPEVVGFSLYNTNVHATVWIAQQLRILMPDTCFMIGGPLVNDGLWDVPPGLFNYVFVGEAEENLLNVLENLPDIYPTGEKIGSTSSKLNLDYYAYPDYSDYNLQAYQHKDGVSIETSRGCVAQCSFCSETYFWKFRSLTPERVVDEIKHQIDTYKISRFWFVDSLVNGNIKSFQRLVDLIIENNIKIKWNSYARCDGRMTRDFLFKVAQSGCTALSYGVESGSQKVLNDMRKKVEIWEIENNLKDSYDAGIYTHINLMWGFPSEEPIDCLHSLQLLYNCRNWIEHISPGYGAGPATGSHMATDWKVYGIEGETGPYSRTFLGHWYTINYKNTLVARFLRIKIGHIWLEILKEYTGCLMVNAQSYDTLRTFYTFEITERTDIDYLENDEYVNFDRFSGEDLSTNLAKEYLPFLYSAFRYFGAYKFSVICDPVKDDKTFGGSIARTYTSQVNFEIDIQGNYTLSISHSLLHETTVEDMKAKVVRELDYHNLSFDQQTYTDAGNINSWQCTTPRVKETIHEQYRGKTKKVIPILLND